MYLTGSYRLMISIVMVIISEYLFEKNMNVIFSNKYIWIKSVKCKKYNIIFLSNKSRVSIPLDHYDT